MYGEAVLEYGSPGRQLWFCGEPLRLQQKRQCGQNPDPHRGQVLWEYNAVDRLITELHVDKEAGIHNRTELVYDKAGNLVEITDNQGGKTWVEYDLLNREIRRIEKDGGVSRSF